MTNHPVKLKQSNGDILTLNFMAAFLAESRYDELATLTKEKLPEFISCMINGISELSRYIALLERESAIYSYKLDKRRSRLLVDIVPQQIEEKKLRSSEDLRSSMVELDEEYSKFQEEIIEVDYAKNMCKARLKALDAVYFSAQKIMETVRGNSPINGYSEMDRSFGSGVTLR